MRWYARFDQRIIECSHTIPSRLTVLPSGDLKAIRTGTADFSDIINFHQGKFACSVWATLPTRTHPSDEGFITRRRCKMRICDVNKWAQLLHQTGQHLCYMWLCSVPLLGVPASQLSRPLRLTVEHLRWSELPLTCKTKRKMQKCEKVGYMNLEFGKKCISCLSGISRSNRLIATFFNFI